MMGFANGRFLIYLVLEHCTPLLGSLKVTIRKHHVQLST